MQGKRTIQLAILANCSAVTSSYYSRLVIQPSLRSPVWHLNTWKLCSLSCSVPSLLPSPGQNVSPECLCLCTIIRSSPYIQSSVKCVNNVCRFLLTTFALSQFFPPLPLHHVFGFFFSLLPPFFLNFPCHCDHYAMCSRILNSLQRKRVKGK